MKYAHVYTLFLVFVFHTSCGQSQTNPAKDNVRYNGYSESQLKELAVSRVPMSQVRNIKQDRNGNILIAATWGGVFRYDARLPDGQGKSFTNLTSKLGYHRFWDVLEDRRGNLWFASLDSGVYYYNGKSFQHFTTREGLVNNAVMSIYEDKAGIIWFGTEGGGVSRYDGKSFRNFTTNEGSSNNITTIIEDKTGKLWFGAQAGDMFVYDARLPDGQGKTFTVLTDKDGNAFKNVWSIIEDKKGNIWFGDNNGLWRYDGRTFTQVSQRGAYGIIEDKKGNIWTTGVVNPPIGKVWAVSRYDAKSLYNKMPTVTEIKSGGIMDFMGILEANDGSIWIGSAGGVYRYDGKTFTDFKSKESH
jgi:ligand-binding sensor domain-containing protein